MLDKIAALIKEAIAEILKKETLQDAGDQLVERVKTRTRLGKGVQEPGGQATNLKRLEPQTVKRRTQLRKRGQLTGKNATPAKSGINRTGKTLDSMTAKAKTGEIKIELDSLGKQVATELQKISKDYTFMNLSQAELKFLVKTLEQKVQSLNQKLK